VLWAALLLCAPPAPAPAQEAATGLITGVVQLPPPAPKTRSFRGELYRRRLAPTRETEAPSPAPRSPYGDVVVSAHPQARTAPLAGGGPRLQMEQVDAVFVPHVLPIRVGTTVEFINRDNFYHNVFSLSPPGNFDLGRKPTGDVVEHTFEQPGEVKVFCDIHPQMNAVILVLDTPWFTQPDSTGAFVLTGLPAGRYQVRAYHPEHELLQRDVEVGGGVPVVQSFLFGR